MALKGSLSGSFSTASGVTTASIDVSSLSIANGDLVLVTLHNATQTLDRSANSVTVAPNVTTGGPFAKDIGVYANGSTRDTNLYGLHYVANGADTSLAFAALNASSAYFWQVWVETGVDGPTPLDVSPVSASGSATDRPNPAAITPATSGARIIAFYHGSSTASPTAWGTPTNVSDFTPPFSTGSGTIWGQVAAGDATWSGSGAFDPAAVTVGGHNGPSDSWAALTYSLRTAVSGTNGAGSGGVGSVAATAPTVAGSGGGNAAAAPGTVAATAPTAAGSGSANAAAGPGTATATATTGIAAGNAAAAGGIGTATTTAPTGIASSGGSGSGVGPIGTAVGSPPSAVGSAGGDGAAPIGQSEVFAPDGVATGSGGASGGIQSAAAVEPGGIGAADGGGSAGSNVVQLFPPDGQAGGNVGGIPVPANRTTHEPPKHTQSAASAISATKAGAVTRTTYAPRRAA